MWVPRWLVACNSFGAGTALLSSGDGVRAAQQAHAQGASDSEALRYGVGMGVLAAAGDVFDVGAAGKGAAGVSHGVPGILQSARRGAASDAASDMAGLLWQQWMLGENSELSQMRRAMLAAGLTEEEAAFQMGMALASRFGTDAAEGAITAGMSDALGRGVRGAKNWLGGTSEPANVAQGLDTTPAAGNNGSAQTFTEGAQPWHAPEDFAVSDRALPHLQNVEGYKGNRFAGISGGHDMNSLLTYIHEQLPHLTDDPDELIVSRTEHPTIQGIYNIYYRVPKQDGKGNFTGEYKTFAYPKTVYDPAVLSPQQISNWAMEAFTGPGAVIQKNMIEGTASNGLHFVGFLDRNNPSVLNNFYFVFSQKE